MIFKWIFCYEIFYFIKSLSQKYFGLNNESIRIIPKFIGLVSGIPAFYGVIFYLLIRLKKSNNYSRFTYHTDWIFLMLIFLSILSGYTLDILKWASAVRSYYTTFAFHLIVVFELLVTFPFTKFAHVMYRPFALLIADIKK